MLRQSRDMKVIAEVETMEELIEQVKSQEPDIVLTSIKFPELDTITDIKMLREMKPLLGIIVMSAYGEARHITEMIDAGANGYVMKSARKKEFFDGIKLVYTGRSYYCSETATRLATLHQHKASLLQKHPPLSQRELKIIEFICLEKTNKEIAKELFLSPRTIEALRLSVQEKVKVKSPVGLAIYALQSGLLGA